SIESHNFLVCCLLCEEDIGVCEQQPCQNGGVCQRQSSGFRCLCSQSSQNGRLYGGETCADALSGCDDHRCENGGICWPLLVQDQHTYWCGCLAGFSGTRCQTPTAFSFQGSGGFLRVETPVRGAPLRLAFSFRTRGLAGTLLQRRVDHLLLTVELLSGQLRISGRRGQGLNTTLVQELQGNVSDGEWHAVEASLSGGGGGGGGGEDGDILFLGAPGLTPGVGEEAPAAFRGCFRDVVVDSELVLPRGPGPEAEEIQVNVTMGCTDEDLCGGAPCGGRGRCVAEGWRDYRCVCHRPYQGADCQRGEYEAMSYSVFSLVDPPSTLASDQQPPTLVVSMFVHTELPSGLLLVLANSSSQYLRVWLEEGRVKVQLNGHESVRGEDASADGRFRLLTVEVWDHVAVLTQAGHTQASVSIRPVQPRPGDKVFIGGLPDPRAAAVFGGYFRGCVQDLRINGRPLQVFPLPGSVPAESHRLEQSVHVIPGCGSDCAGAPCLNGGVCDPRGEDCSCPPGAAGRRCEEVRWCELSPCPSSAVCASLPHGFQSGAFGGNVLCYRGNGHITRPLTSLLLHLRTRQTDATVLQARRGSTPLLTVSLRGSHLAMELWADGEVAAVSVQSGGPVADGRWHTVELRMETPAAERSRWVVEDDGRRAEARLSDAVGGSLDFLREGVDILLGAGNSGEGLDGCLGPLEIGGIPLPFHRDEELSLPRPQKEQFLLWKVEADTCWDHRCGPGATCLRGQKQLLCCVCRRPELPVVECKGRGWNYSCFHGGSCSGGALICHCAAGFTGHWYAMPPNVFNGISLSSHSRSPRCETDVDECASDPCMHGGLCLDQQAGWECVCDQNYWGLHCQMDASDFHLYLFLALWQNFLQLLSYQMWHLDEVPEIEWANQVED
uniref:Uncharacterized protein n=1 Tax=Gadus morhua TaxID=8049 RepID=A0A8C5CVJ2_GADMO